MIKLLENYLQEWRTKKDILAFLMSDDCTFKTLLSEREWRAFVKRHNKRKYNGVEKYYLAHGSMGYKLTNDPKEIKASAMDFLKRAIDMLREYWQAMGIIKHEVNVDFSKELEELEKEMDANGSL